eukprot:2222580-Ditylum_brightwellii.AAC.1
MQSASAVDKKKGPSLDANILTASSRIELIGSCCIYKVRCPGALVYSKKDTLLWWMIKWDEGL